MQQYAGKNSGARSTTASTPVVAFSGTLGTYLGILLVNVVGTLLTLGIYRFWARTRSRRFLWSSVSIDAEPFEYTGTGLQLFIGFLFAVIVLAVLGFAAGGLAFLAMGGMKALSTPEGIVVIEYAVLLSWLPLIPIAIYRARRYLLAHTVWRGVRFGQVGSSFTYLLQSIGYGLLYLVTLGLANPWVRLGLTSYMMRNTRFGDTAFDFEAYGSSLFFRWFIAWLVGIAAIAAFYAAFFLLIAISNPIDGPTLLRAMELTPEEAVKLAQITGIGAALGFVLMFVASTWYRVGEFHVTTRGTSLGRIELESGLSTLRLVIYQIPPMLGIIAYLAVFAYFFVALLDLTLAQQAADPNEPPNPQAMIAVLVPFAAALVVIGILQAVLGYVAFFFTLRHMIETLKIKGFDYVDVIAQGKGGAPGSGEGLADALDLGAV